MKILLEIPEGCPASIYECLGVLADRLDGYIKLPTIDSPVITETLGATGREFKVTLSEPNRKPVLKPVITQVPHCPNCGAQLEKVTDPDARTMMDYICSKSCGYAY